MTYVFLLGVSAAPTAQLALNNKAHELQMCKKKMEWQNEKIEELTKERDFLKEQLASGKSPNTMFSQSVGLFLVGSKEGIACPLRLQSATVICRMVQECGL